MSVDVRPQDATPSLTYERLDRLVESHHTELVALRHDLHRHPELSNRERRTASVVAEHLRGLGLDDVRTGIAGHGVVGVLRGGLPGDRVVALRADMDALPLRETSGEPFASTVVDRDYPGGPHPVAHACGHDCHMAVVLTAASVLAEVRDRLPGTALFVFQPAEEGPPIGERSGARAMIDDGAFVDPEPTMVFGMHVSPLPEGVVAFRSGVQFAASSLVRIVVEGVGTHGSSPWLGHDPMPAAAAIIGGAAQLHRQVSPMRPIAVTIGHVEDVGRFNVIGGTVTLWGTVRALAAADIAFGGVYLQYGVQDADLADGAPIARPGGRGVVPNHHPAFYANDSALADSVRLHVHVAVDHLAGLLEVGA